MFKRGEESEWSRFSKAFTGKEKEHEDRTDTAVEDDPNLQGTELIGPADPTAAPMVSPAARPPTSDTNLTVARATTNPLPQSLHDEDVESVLGDHSFFDGTYRSESSIRIRGVAQGDIECGRSVFIEENARVSAKVSAANILVAGEVNGELNCSGRVEIRPSGRVTGTINAASLVMQEGAFFDGNLRMKQDPELAER